MTTGKLLLKLRSEAEMTQEELADRSSISREAICKYETGFFDINKAKHATLISLAWALGVDPVSFVACFSDRVPLGPKSKAA